MDDVFVYLTALPDGINELVLPCADGYTVYLDDGLDQAGRIDKYEHAIEHIRENDFSKSNVQEIECDAHGVV